MKEQVRKNHLQTIHTLQRYASGALLHLAVAVTGFVCARQPVLGAFTPLALALTAGVPNVYTLTAGIGSFLGYILPFSGGSIHYIAGLFAVVAIRFLLAGIRAIQKTPLLSALTALAATAATGLATLSLRTDSSLLLVICESLITGGCAYFFARAAALYPFNTAGLPGDALASIMIALDLVLLGYVSFGVFGLSVGRIFMTAIVLLAAKSGKTAAGAISGISAGFAIVLGGGSFTVSFAIFALGGLLAGIFAPVGRIMESLVYLVGGSLVLMFGGDGQAVTFLIEMVLGGLLFLATPAGLQHRFSALFAPPADLSQLDGLRRSLVMRLDVASQTLEDVAQTVTEVSDQLRQIAAPAFDQVLQQVECDACKGCSLRIHCWERVRSDTVSALLDMVQAIRHGEQEPETAAPEAFAERCLRLPRLSRSVFLHYSDYLAKQAAENRIEELRSVVSDQFSGISNMLADMAETFQKETGWDLDMAGRVTRALREAGLVVRDCSCFIDRFERISVELRVKKNGDAVLNKAHVLRLIEDVCERTFDPPEVTATEGEHYVCLREKAVYDTDMGVTQFACQSRKLCGDAYHCFRDGRGHSYMLLSDGMGNGGRAAVDGAMASGLMSRLLKAGFGFDCSLRMVNSAMLFKSTDESLATVDIACIDLYTGRTELFKAGAAPTLVRRSGRTGKAESRSLPIGILREVGFDKANISLRPNDIILLLSDGAAACGTDWICAELEAWKDGSAQQLADHIASCARRRRNDGHEDDITVISAILKKAV